MKITFMRIDNGLVSLLAEREEAGKAVCFSVREVFDRVQGKVRQECRNETENRPVSAEDVAILAGLVGVITKDYK